MVAVGIGIFRVSFVSTTPPKSAKMEGPRAKLKKWSNLLLCFKNHFNFNEFKNSPELALSLRHYSFSDLRIAPLGLASIPSSVSHDPLRVHSLRVNCHGGDRKI